MMYSWSKSDRQLIRCVFEIKHSGYALVFNIEDHIGFVVYTLLKAPRQLELVLLKKHRQQKYISYIEKASFIAGSGQCLDEFIF